MNEYAKLMPVKEKLKILSLVAKRGIKLLEKESTKDLINAWFDYLKCTLKCFLPEYYLSFEFIKSEWKNKTYYEQLKCSIEWLIEILRDIKI